MSQIIYPAGNFNERKREIRQIIQRGVINICSYNMLHVNLCVIEPAY